MTIERGHPHSPICAFSFVGAVIVLSITPGPDLLLLVSKGMAQGWKAKASWFTAFGFTLAGIIRIPLLALGVASRVQSSPVAFDLWRYSGAAYLIWRGVRLLRSTGASARLDAVVATSPAAALRDGVVASLTNPKGLIFLPGGVDGFDEDEAQGECDDGSEGAFGFLVAQGDTLEVLELSEALFDAARPLWSAFGRRSMGPLHWI